VGVVNAIPIVRPGAHGRAVAVVDLIRLADGTRTFQVARDIVYADAVEPDAAMAALLAPYMVQADAIGGMPVTTLGETLSSEDRRLGDLVADAERLVAQADFAMHNPGGLRADLLAGKVSYGDLYRVLPFGNIVVRLTLSGRQLRQVVEQAGRSYYFSNLQVAYDPNAPPGSRVVSLTFADGRPVLEDRTYTLATIDFLADGGGDFTMLQPLARQSFGVTDLDALATLLRDLPAPVVVAEKRPTFAIRGE
jgi:5'-nucleotidase